MSEFQQGGIDIKQIVSAIGIGFVVGAGGILLIKRLTREDETETHRLLQKVVLNVSELRKEWQQFKQQLQEEKEQQLLQVQERESRRSKSPWRRSYRSAPTTSGSEDEFEEAHEDILHQNTSHDAQVLWRLAKAKVLVGEIVNSQGDGERQKELVYSARDDAEKAVGLDEFDAEAHKYYSITQGIISDWVPLSEAMGIGKLFKFHLEKALELKPTDAYISHLYGRFIYTLANMGWVQRKAVVTMYGLTEPVSLDTALKWFKKAESLEPGFSNCNPFYMAECYIKKGETDPVAELLEKSITFQGNSVEVRTIL
ncbi:putative regulator of microtubule dynamics protein 1 [Apostichopus japonicus]|uniref:Regulator of microtubule dynamics protein 1 n=1 Tax=Stichopus japonicus TaxID=307972 RepID=A0A2G8LQW6_STIJA|nr:putative regulator of microtubule dynamics protein 1 [Apostichopus japonicus]